MGRELAAVAHKPAPASPAAPEKSVAEAARPRVVTNTGAPTVVIPTAQAPPAAAVVPATVAPSPRKSEAFAAWLRQLDRQMYWKKYNLTHITAYFGMSLVIFFLAASWRVWPLLVIMALLSEIVPNALYNTWDIDDWWDLAADFTGILSALAIVMILRRCFLGREEMPENEELAEPALVTEA
jgi:hypothetical protein